MDGIPLPHLLTALFAGWYDAKMVIERVGAISPDALHVLAGVLLQLLVAVVLRRSVASWLPWSAVFALLIFNEAVDLWVERWPSLTMQLAETLKDVILTMLLPSALLLAFRLAPGLCLPRRD